MSTTLRKTPHLIVTGLTGAALALVPVTAHASDTAATTADLAQPRTTTGATTDGEKSSGPVTITSPLTGATVAPGDVTFTGTGTPGESVVVWIDQHSPVQDSGLVATPLVRADGTWSASMPLEPGAYSLDVRNVDSSSRASVTFRVAAEGASSATT